ncbi:MAG: hypothetical protein K2P58_00380 [Hyphomonadaceae bacterium]|nr:hypothetical protein [Hyphomonadaceae bacterium]
MAKERWEASRNADGSYDFVVKRAPLPLPNTIIATFFSGGLVLPLILLINSQKHRFSAGPSGFVVKGENIPLGRVNDLEIRNSNNRTIFQNGGGFVAGGTGATGVLAAGAAHAYNELARMALNEEAKSRNKVVIQVGSRFVPLAKDLKEEHARGLVADIMRAIEGRL